MINDRQEQFRLLEEALTKTCSALHKAVDALLNRIKRIKALRTATEKILSVIDITVAHVPPLKLIKNGFVRFRTWIMGTKP